MRVFVTGGTGFVGHHVLARLVEAGHQVRALRRGAVGGRWAGPAGVAWVPGEVLDRASLEAGMAGCEAVIHAAAQLSTSRRDFGRQREVNVGGTENAVAAALRSGIRRFVHTSSIAALGRPVRGAVADEQQPYDWEPGFNYQETKRDSERVALAASQQGMEVVSLNPALVLGPEEPHRRSLRLLRVVKRGLARLAPPGGNTICDVRDVAAAHVAALSRGRSGERYILGGPYVSFEELLTLYARALQRPAPVAAVPASLVRAGQLALFGFERLAPVPLPASPAYLSVFLLERRYTSARAEGELGYRTRPARETVGDTVAWYRAQGLV
jgi:nucleoside-diphosphate-sugar epimerase